MTAPAFARLSAPGPAALSCWLLEGPGEAVEALAGRPLPPVDRPVRVRLPDGQGGCLDEGVLWVRAAGPGRVRAELHLHGGQGVAAALRTRLAELGWREEPSLGGGEDPELGRLVAARSPAAAAAASALLGGAFEALLERLAAAPREAAARTVRRLLRRCAWARLLEAPPRLVLAGPANAGKSTLFNAWLAEERVTVSPHPGTTRDAVEAGILLGRGPAAFEVVLVDTAGLWEAPGDLDRAAVALAREALRDAWRVVWVLDAASPPPPPVLRELSGAHPRDVFLRHRSDLLSAGGGAPPPAPGPWLAGSVLREGPALIRRLEAALLAPLGPPPPPGSLVPLGAGRRAALRRLALRLS